MRYKYGGSCKCVSKFQLKPNQIQPFDELSHSNLRYFKRKRDEFLHAAKNYFDESFTSGQSAEKIKEVLEHKKDDPVPDDLLPLIENYGNGDSFGKLVILSLVNHDIHSKTELMKIFGGCSKKTIDQARAMQMKQKGVWLNTEKCELLNKNLMFQWADVRWCH